MKVKVGIIGLGNIAQSTYLPLLSSYNKVEIIGAYSPNLEKSKMICDQYRIAHFTSMKALVDEADALFVHSATHTHYEIVKYILLKKKHVYVDKPLVETSSEAEELLQIAAANHVKLMIGFNRRFAPAYQKLKSAIEQKDFQYVKVEKHRMGLSNQDIFDILLDDYIHLVDTISWLVSDPLEIAHVDLHKNEANQLQFISVEYRSQKTKQVFLQTVSHRSAGTNLEKITVISDNQYIEVKDFLETTITSNDIATKESMSLLRQTDYARRGFTNIVDEFISAIIEDREINNFEIDGVNAQKLIEALKPYI